MAGNLVYPRSLALVAIVMAASWMCSLPRCSADKTVTPMMTTAGASGDNVPVPAAAGVPVGSPSATPAATAATLATTIASKKIPLPVPETLPGAEGLGFGGGYGGGQTVPGGGLGGFNGDQGFFGGCCGGFGYNGGPGYNNGPLFFNSAPATRLRLRMVATGNGFAPLLVAGAAAMFYA